MSLSAPKSIYQAHLRTPSPDTDAGLRGLTHYERRLPKWRYRLRQWLIPMVRQETPLLAQLQQRWRSPMLDSYFAMTANLGTHTFFMTALPICFWCGYPAVATALVQMLAAGVYLSGYAKDMVCLPRPLSPPLQRITMSGSAALEYGFPSTHTTNAVSVAAFILHNLWQSREQYSPSMYRLFVALCIFYATSISLGRMYCGMHGFFDVIFGAILGALITGVRVLYGSWFDIWVISGSWGRPGMAIALLLLAVRFHPEPADNCPCFDDSVAFLGVVMGVSLGTWLLAAQNFSGATPSLDQMYPYTNDNLLKALARLVGGIVVIFTWRALMKRLLLSVLPPIYRFVSNFGATIPRRYFLQARDYTTVPQLRQDDKVIPPASEIPEMLSSISRRKRTISVGPQSEADAREFIANRAQVRRESREAEALKSQRSRSRLRVGTPAAIDEHPLMTPDESPATSYLTAKSDTNGTGKSPLHVSVAASNLLTPPPSDAGASSSDSSHEDEKNDRMLFSILEKPRIRYDVEVITKLIVYAGIAFLAVNANPHLFAILGID